MKLTVVPMVRARHGFGGWIEMIARLGRVNRGGNAIVSIATTPPAVSMVVRLQPPGQPDTSTPGGRVNGTPITKVFGATGSRWTVTT